jgi:ribulose-bisphosphate carboxylase large chain
MEERQDDPHNRNQRYRNAVGVDFGVMQKLWRFAGGEHLHVNGLANKFTESDDVVGRAAQSVQQPISGNDGPAHIAMPVYSSGQTIWQLAPARKLLGNDDCIFCAGGGIMSHPGGAGDGATSLRDAANAALLGIPLKEFAAPGSPLESAIDHFERPVSLL